MRLLLLSFLLLSFAGISNDYVDGLPNGHFAGEGSWQDNFGNEGTYHTYVAVENNDVRIDYGFDNQSLTIYLSFWFSGPGIFDVIHEDGVIGHGYCAIGECHYEISANDVYSAESLYFSTEDGSITSLVKNGHQQIGDRIIHWQDNLVSLNIETDPPIAEPYPPELVLPLPPIELTPPRDTIR